MKLYVLDNGKIVMETGNGVTLDDGTPQAEKPAIPIHSFLLDTEIGYILFDAACDPEGMTKNWPEWLRANPYVMGENGSVMDRLAQIGVKPEEIDYVVMSHLHVDHAGCLYAFNNAKVFVNEDELITVLKNYANNALDGTFHVKSDVESWLKAGVRWCPVDRDSVVMELCHGVSILNFGSGHSYGMLGMYLELSCGNYVLAADSIYSAAHFGPPAQMAGICADEDGYFEIIEYIRKFADEHNAVVLFGHDMEQFKSLKKSTEGFYE